MSNNDGAGEALLFVTATIWNGRLLPETKKITLIRKNIIFP